MNRFATSRKAKFSFWPFAVCYNHRAASYEISISMYQTLEGFLDYLRSWRCFVELVISSDFRMDFEVVFRAGNPCVGDYDFDCPMRSYDF